jgi:hypothetical protein
MNRLRSTTTRIGTERTGLKSAIFVHVEFDRAGNIHAVRLSEKGRDNFTLDNMFNALGDAITESIRELQGMGAN